MERRDPSRVGELVRRHRTAAALSQEALAERAGLSVRAISDLERGVHQRAAAGDGAPAGRCPRARRGRTR